MSGQLFIPFFLDKKMWDTSKTMLFLSELYLEQLSETEKREWKYALLPPYQSVRSEEVWTNVTPFVEKLISVLDSELSKLHGVNYSHDYWHRLLFAWLERYCVLKYYQVTLFEKIRERYPYTKFYTRVYENEYDVIWENDGVSNWNSVGYFFRVAEIGARFFDLTVEKKPFVHKVDLYEHYQKREVGPKKSFRKKIFQKNVGIKVLYRILNKRDSRKVRVLYNNSYLREIDVLRMVTKSYGKIRPMSLEHKLKPRERNINFRNHIDKILKNSVKGEMIWQKVSISFLAEELSAVFIEWYSEMHSISLRYLEQYPNLKVIRGVNDFYYSSIVSFCSFLAKERSGVKLLGIQHGGTYGIIKNEGKIEKCEEDLLYGWGSWAKYRDKGYRQGPSGKLYRYFYLQKSKDYMLFVGKYIPTKIAQGSKESNSMDGTRYISWQLRFFKILNENIISNLAVRNYYVDGGWEINKKLKKEIPGIRISNRVCNNFRRVNFSQRDDDFVFALSRCSMMICDHLSTTWLEALAADKPLLMFYPEGYYLYEESELPYVKMMEAVGILVHSPEVAAETLNQISGNINEWWNEPERKKVIAIIKDRYISSEKDVAKWWVDELLSVAKE